MATRFPSITVRQSTVGCLAVSSVFVGQRRDWVPKSTMDERDILVVQAVANCRFMQGLSVKCAVR